jgi:hypothetical protein
VGIRFPNQSSLGRLRPVTDGSKKCRESAQTPAIVPRNQGKVMEWLCPAHDLEKTGTTESKSQNVATRRGALCLGTGCGGGFGGVSATGSRLVTSAARC